MDFSDKLLKDETLEALLSCSRLKQGTTYESGCSSSKVFQHLLLSDVSSSNDFDESSYFEFHVKQKIPEDVLSSLSDELTAWYFKFNITQASLTALLKILKTCNKSEIDSLPCDGRTLMSTPRNVVSTVNGKGKYIYFGFRKALQHFQQMYCVKEAPSFMMNIDGFPIFKSSNLSLWPVLASFYVRNIENSSVPYIIALWCGSGKPDINDYFNDAVAEIMLLYNENYLLLDGPIICDTTARAFAKQTKSHCGYHGCDKCEEEGTYIQESFGKKINGRITFPGVNAVLRTNDGFRMQADCFHHIGNSPFLKLPIDMISQFPLDPMHLLYLGVMKKLLHLWWTGPNFVRFSPSDREQMSSNLANTVVPKEFARQPRTLKELNHFKACEFRQFLLYSGPIVLKPFMENNMYKHFMLIHVAVFIMSHPEFHLEMLNDAKNMLEAFATHFCKIYGEDSMSYNVHSLIHIADDVRKYGPLHCFSAFKFESFLHQIKRKIRGRSNCLQQVSNRYEELLPGNFYFNAKTVSDSQPEEKHSVISYVENKNITIQIGKSVYTFTNRHPNNICKLKTGKVFCICDIFVNNGEIKLKGKACSKKGDFYKYLLNSSALGILFVEKCFTVKCFDPKEISGKYVPFYLEEQMIIFPFLHVAS